MKHEWVVLVPFKLTEGQASAASGGARLTLDIGMTHPDFYGRAGAVKRSYRVLQVRTALHGRSWEVLRGATRREIGVRGMTNDALSGLSEQDIVEGVSVTNDVEATNEQVLFCVDDLNMIVPSKCPDCGRCWCRHDAYIADSDNPNGCPGWTVS